jgi:hypothetical protein
VPALRRLAVNMGTQFRVIMKVDHPTQSVGAAQELSPVARLLPHGKEWYTSKEVAQVIGRSAQYVRDCFDNQKLMGHALNARGAAGEEKRKSYQIPRAALMLYLMETANYHGGDYAQRVLELMDHLAPDERRSIGRLLAEGRKSVWSA